MKIVVVGAGAVGCYFGGLLARAGHEVTLVGRPPHVAAIRESGLLMDTLSFQGAVPVAATTEISAVAGAEIVLCCVKSNDTPQAGVSMAPWLADNTLILSLQNGVGNVEMLQEVLVQRVAPAVVYVATEMSGPGRVKHHGRGELVLDPVVLTDGQRQQFEAAGVPIVLSDNVAGALWSKLILNCAYNALSALSQQPYGQLWQVPGVQTVMQDVLRECLVVAAADGVDIPGDPWAAIVRIAESMPGQCSSTAQDMARQKPSEIDHLNGYVVRRGAAHGIPTPVNHLLHTLVKLRESAFLPAA